MLVKCRDLNNEKRPKEQCYKAPNKKYYSSEEAYLALALQEQWRDKCTSAMQNVMGYEYDQKLPTRWYKFLKELKGYGYDVVYDTIEANRDTFLWAIKTKNFLNDSCALAYFNAIIQNDAMNHLKAKQAREKAERIQKKDVEKANEISSMCDVGQKSAKGKDLSNLFNL